MAFSLPSLTFQLFVDGAWTTYPASWSEGWSIRTGPDPDTGLTPNKIELTLVNDDLSMDPSNVTSPLYGKIGQNTPCRLLDSGFTLTRAEASDWQPDSTVEHSVSTGKGRAWVTLTAEGLLRRLGKWEDPLDSPMTRQTNSYASLIGHSPLEDPSGAASLSNAVPGVRSGYYRGTVSLAGNTGAGGSGPCMQMGSDGFIAGYFSAPAGSGYQICFAAKLSANPSSATYQTILQWGDTLGRTWAWQVNNSAYQIVITDQDGATIDTTAFTYGSAPPNQWIRYRMKVTVSGSTLTYEPATYVQDRSFSTGVTDTFTSTATGRPRSWTASGNAWTDGAAYTNVFAVTDTSLDLLSGNAADAFNGYLGERAGWRFARLMDELGLQAYLDGDADLSAPMGRQKPGRALDLLDECSRTDGGLLFDEVLDIALTLRLHNALINQSVTLALTKGTNIAPPLRKLIGDVGTANDITITNWDGTELRLEQETGPKSVQPPPAGVGRYKLPLAVNVRDSDNQLFWRGTWELANGTLKRPRYRQVTVNLVANPSLRSTITTMRSGHLVSLTGVEPDVVYLRVISIERSGSDTTDVAVLNCLPADAWLTGEYDDTSYRYDSRTTTLGVARDTVQTSFTFSFTNSGDSWSTTAEPYDVLIAGERITVTSMGAVSGSGPYTQTATVTRSVNGVVKSLAAGEEIHVFRPARYAMGGI